MLSEFIRFWKELPLVIQALFVLWAGGILVVAVLIPVAVQERREIRAGQRRAQARIEAQVKELKAQEEAELQALIKSQVEQGDNIMVEYLMRQVNGG